MVSPFLSIFIISAFLVHLIVSISSSLHSSAQQHQIKKMHPETMPVEVRADEVGFGMALEGGSTEYGLFPITISSIEVNGPAARFVKMLTCTVINTIVE